ncbi:MAG: carboxymuconolactone decarboxylase family protein [Dysgonomonas sp.]
MSKMKFSTSILFFVLTLGFTKMNAQENNAQNQSLDSKQQGLAAISALTATGNLEELNNQLNQGLDTGLTINEIKEALVQLYAYCGFPRILNAINTFRTVLEQRKSKGINDKIGVAIIEENDVPDKYEQGRKVLEKLTRTKQIKPAPGFGEFAPRVDTFLKEHLFADIFASDVLSYQQRELVTISALATMQGVDPQLKSHIGMGKNTGMTQLQLREICYIIERYINKNQANIFSRLIDEVFEVDEYK